MMGALVANFGLRQCAGCWAKSRYAPAATVPPDKELYQRQIVATDRQIDALVYELYGLGEEEIALIEEQ